MSYEAQRGRGGWYRPVDPNEHIYIEGYGFSPRPPYLVEQKLIARSSNAVVFCLMGMLLMSGMLPIILQDFIYNSTAMMALPFSWSSATLELVDGVSSILSLVVPFAVYASVVGIPRESALPFRPVAPLLMLAALAVTLAVGVAGSYAGQAFESVMSAFGVYFYYPFIDIPHGMTGVIYCINATLVPAVFEECAFRGVLMQSLRRFGDSFALVCSALLFAVVHLSPVSMPNALVMGLCIGYFVLFTGSISTGIVLHFVFNVYALCSAQLGLLGDEAGYVLYLLLDLLFLLVGIIAILWLVRGYRNMFALKSSSTINRSNQKLRSFFGTLPMLVLALVILWNVRGYLL